MKELNAEKLNSLNINLMSEQIEKFNKYMEKFLEKNSQVNLISKNDENFLFEKHVFDSLAITLFLKPKQGQTILDIGTGGGFPSIPVALFYENLEVFALDSIKKKIKAVEDLKEELNLKNLHPICKRVEDLDQQFDYVTSRAVTSLDSLLIYAAPKLKKYGYFIAYKSKKSEGEIKEAQKTMKRLGIKLVKTIDYKLPLDEIYERNLLIFKKS